MDYDETLHRVLTELRRTTGLELEIRADSPEEKSRAAEQLRLLTAAYKEKYDKIHFLRSLMTGELPAYRIQEHACRFHIAFAEPRILYLVEAEQKPDDLLQEVLRGLLPSRTAAYLIPVSGNLTAVLCSRGCMVKDGQGSPELAFARTMVDMLNAEAFTRIRVSYSRVSESLADLSAAFQETGLAPKIGKLFFSGETVFPCGRLGVGRLIYGLPYELCENFLREIFGEDIPPELDEETAVTASQFFENNLNIAETARQLHVHRNTLIYRLEQIQNRTGLDLRRFEDAAAFKIATMVINYLRTERNQNA